MGIGKLTVLRHVPTFWLGLVAGAILVLATSGSGSAQTIVTDLPAPGVFKPSWQPPVGEIAYVVRPEHVRGFDDATTTLEDDLRVVLAPTQAETEVLHSRAGTVYWEEILQVPIAGTVGHWLQKTGENDEDYAFRALDIDVSDYLQLSVGGGLAFTPQGQLHTSPSLVTAAREADEAKLVADNATRDLVALSGSLPASFPTAQGFYSLEQPIGGGRPTWAVAPQSGLSEGEVDDRVAAITPQYIDVEPGVFSTLSETTPQAFHLLLSGYPTNMLPDVDSIRITFSGTPVHTQSWTFASGPRVIDFTVSGTDLRNAVRAAQRDGDARVQVNFRENAVGVLDSRIRSLPTVEKGRFETTLSASPATLPEGTYEIVIAAHETGTDGVQYYEWRKLVSNLTSSQREYTAVTQTPSSADDEHSVFLRASYISATRVLTYSIGGEDVTLETIKAIGER